MQIFEINFNQKPDGNRYFGSFSFEPDNSYEKALGSLYMVGDLENSTLKDESFLKKISQSIKEKFYSASYKKTNKALAESLKAGNNYLAEEIKKENVNWLGNLNFGVLAIKNSDLSFTATGSLKILLLRAEQINDISKDLNATEIEPFPLKVFFNVVSGKLMEKDIILAISKELYDFFTEKKVLEKIAGLSALNEKKLREILPAELFEEAENLNISGVCTIFEFGELSSKAKEIVFRKKEPNFIEKIKAFRIPKIGNILPRMALKKPAKINLKVKAEGFKENTDLRKNIILIVALIVILILGFAVFQKNEQIKNDKNTAYFKELGQKFIDAENAIKYGENNKGELLLKEILNNISQFTLENNPIKNEAIKLKELVEEKLYEINKIKRIENPEVLTDIDIKSLEFVPQTLMISGYNMYLSSPISPNLYIFDLNNRKGNVLKYNQNLELADDLSSFIIFFSRPDKVIFLENGKLREEKISLPEEKISFDLMSSYVSNIYFLNQEKNKIIKYSYGSNFKWGEPKTAFVPKEKAKSFAIDSYFWLLNEGNAVDVYYKGNYEKTVSINIFPEIKNLTKIKTKAGLPYLYLLEPANNRLIITDKSGNIVEQLQSGKFDNLKDFSISSNGSTIWILNGEQIFRVEM